MEFFNAAKGALPNAIIGFTGRYYWLSNDAAVNVEFDGVTYPSVTHAFAASGTNDKGARARIAEAADVATVRAIAREAAPNYKVEMERIDALAQLLKEKFQHPEFRAKLKATQKAFLVHKNERGDTIWGVCHERGYNLLGRTLMLLRERIIEEDGRSYSHPPAPSATHGVAR